MKKRGKRPAPEDNIGDRNKKKMEGESRTE